MLKKRGVENLGIKPKETDVVSCPIGPLILLRHVLDICGFKSIRCSPTQTTIPTPILLVLCLRGTRQRSHQQPSSPAFTKSGKLSWIAHHVYLDSRSRRPVWQISYWYLQALHATKGKRRRKLGPYHSRADGQSLILFSPTILMQYMRCVFVLRSSVAHDLQSYL